MPSYQPDNKLSKIIKPLSTQLLGHGLAGYSYAVELQLPVLGRKFSAEDDRQREKYSHISRTTNAPTEQYNSSKLDIDLTYNENRF